MAAYGWILRRDSREAVWVQDLTASTVDRTLVTTRDSVRLEAGAYEVYFTTFGATENSQRGRGTLGLRTHWTNDAKYWRLVVSPKRDVARVVRFQNEGWDDEALWSSGTVGNRTARSTRLRVSSPAAVRIYSAAELCVRDCDVARIFPLGEEAPVWEMTRENTRAAGGMERNRLFDDTVELAPGLYDVLFETDRTHAARSWRANPPLDPLAWGMRLFGVSGDVAEFDPWRGPEPIVSFTEIGNDADLEAVLEVDQTAHVVVVATGEVGSGDTIYDYAWVETETGDRAWEMTVDASEPAGGDKTNRMETAFLTLEPGTYALRYVSDGSHAFGDWRRREPSVPARWGVTMFPLEPADAPRVRVLTEGDRVAPVVQEADEAGETLGDLPPDESLLFGAANLGNDQEREGEFVLESKSRIRVIALGEITDGGQYDFGWIDTADGSRVWEMTRRNTREAGGNAINRLYDGILELDPGRYVVGFETDFSHAVGDFGGGEPPNPEAWGIRVFLLPPSDG
ncbi:MAG: hypothetical protein HKN29_01565 [Rhodothermales bacterium]|nr:hypothetical protein [Rhodothermales bacterium]